MHFSHQVKEESKVFIKRFCAAPLSNDYQLIHITGKSKEANTYSLNSIYTKLKADFPDLLILYSVGKVLTQDLVDHLRTDTFSDLVVRLRSYTIVVIDDFEFLDGKSKSLEMIIQIFKAIVDSGTRVILADVSGRSESYSEAFKGLEEATKGYIAIEF